MGGGNEASGGGYVYLNGDLRAASDVGIDPRDRGFLLGDGVFETLRARSGHTERLDAHLARLRRGAAALSIPLPQRDAALADAIAAVLAENGLTSGTASLRITLSRGPGGRGLPPPDSVAPTLLITASAASDAPMPAARVALTSVARNRHSPTANIKCLGYADQVIARMQATDAGCDEALMPNDAGRLACASAANLFLLRGGRLISPSLDEGVLAGVTRAALLALAPGLGLAVEERPVEPAELAEADAVLLTNSLIGVRAVAQVIAAEDGHRALFQGSADGEVQAAQLAAALDASTGASPR